MQVGIDLQAQFNIRDLITKVTSVPNFESNQILSVISKAFINIFDITVLNPHVEVVSFINYAHIYIFQKFCFTEKAVWKWDATP